MTEPNVPNEEPKNPDPSLGDGGDNNKPSGDGPPTTWDEIYESPRFKQLFARTKSAEEKLSKLTAAQEAAETKALQDQEKWKELADKKSKELDELAAKTRAAELSSMKSRIALSVGLTDPDIIERLVGDTEDDIKADAEKMLAKLGNQSAPSGNAGGIPPGTGTGFTGIDISQMTPKELRELSHEQKLSLFGN